MAAPALSDKTGGAVSASGEVRGNCGILQVSVSALDSGRPQPHKRVPLKAGLVQVTHECAGEVRITGSCGKRCPEDCCPL